MIKKYGLYIALVVIVAVEIIHHININDLYKKVYYLKNVNDKLLNQAKEPSNSVLMIGNSIMSSNDWNPVFDSTVVYNTSIPGLTVFEALHMTKQLVDPVSKNIYINLGVNDINSGTPGKVLVYDYINLLKQIRQAAPKSRLHVISILPLDSTKNTRLGNNIEISLTNSRIKLWCENNYIQFIDIYDYFLDDRKQLKNSFSTDGIHINKDGYNLYMKLLKERLK